MEKTPWTDDETALLRRLHAEGLHDRALAERLGLPKDRVVKKRYTLGLACNPAPRPPSAGYRLPTRFDARAENERPWEPLPGMLKLRCLRCNYWFASPSEHVRTCPECRER